jgi:hypothetical protein
LAAANPVGLLAAKQVVLWAGLLAARSAEWPVWRGWPVERQARLRKKWLVGLVALASLAGLVGPASLAGWV